MKDKAKRKAVAFFGHFDSTNFGNESTLQAFLYNLRRFLPDTEVTCISTGPEATAATHHIDAIPVNESFFKSWVPRNTLTRALRKIFVGIPSEPVRWVRAFWTLRHTDVLIVPGTGLLTDAYGLSSWGPYNLFKWSLIAKMWRCKLLFVSIGAGPIYGVLGRYFSKTMLSLANYRSYRDSSSKEYMLGIGFPSGSDPVYPDLAFSLPEAVIPQHHAKENNSRPVVGLGVMVDSGTYGVSRPSDTYLAYLEKLAAFVEWLLARDYDVRLLSGDVGDMLAWQEFGSLLRKRSPNYDDARVIRRPICSVDDLLSQIAETDLVVATRFHNVLLALFCNKPVIAISFHHKCESLMSAVGLSNYCLDIRDWNLDKLVAKFSELRGNADTLTPLIRAKAREFREALDEQYRSIFSLVSGGAPSGSR